MADQIPLVLLPSLLADQRIFAVQIAALADVASIQVADLTQDVSIPDMAARILAAAPRRFALCGLSIGGYVAMEIIRQEPERVSRLALLNTHARADTDETRQFRRELMALAEQDGVGPVIDRLLRECIHPDRLADQALTATIRAMAHDVGKAGFLNQQHAMMARIDSRPSLAAIGCPTLVLCGREDELSPVELHHEMAVAIPKATLIVLPRCGHLSPTGASPAQ